MSLTNEQKQTARQMAVAAAYLTLHHKDQVHYTQGNLRWEGIDKSLKAWRGEYIRHGDCSSSATWWLWNGLDHFHVSDIVNGEHWLRGYTGTMLHHGITVYNLLPADCIIYGSKWPGEHVAMYVGNGLVISHGSEAGPFLLPWKYRNDVLSKRRYI